MQKILGGLKPDITPAQIVGVLILGVPVVANLLHVFGVFSLSKEQQDALIDTITWCGLLAGVLFLSDVGLRVARNAAGAKVEAASILKDAEPPVGPTPRVTKDAETDAAAAAGDLPSDQDEFAQPPDPVQPPGTIPDA